MSWFFALIGLVLGLYFFRNNIYISITISLLFIIFSLVRLKRRKVTLAFTLSAFIFGLLITQIPRISFNGNFTYSGIVLESKENYFIFYSKMEKFYVYEEKNSREIGDYLIICAEPEDIVSTSYESRFSFDDYLKDKGVERLLSSKNIEVKHSSPIRLKNIKSKFLDGFDEDTKAVVNALLFAEKDYQSTSIRIIDDLNLIFFFSMSGIYLSFLLRVLEKLFKLFLKDRYAEALPFLILLPYSIFLFPKIGVLRVMILTLLKYINNHFLKKHFTYLTIVSFLAVVFLIFDYHLAYQTGFYVGFSLSIGLIFFRTAISRFKKKKQALLVPIFVYLAMLPLSNFNSGTFHIFGLLFQTFLIPFNEIFIIFALISFYVGYPFRIILSNLSKVSLLITYEFLKADIVIPVADYFKYFVFLYYAFLLYGVYLLESGRYFHLKINCLPLVSVVLISLIPVRRYITNAVYFINVGQGDSILLKNKDKTVMIDTGGVLSFDIAKESLIPFLNKKQINHIDLLITTHDDFDHSGGASSLIDNFEVKTYLNSRDQFPVQVGDIYLENLNTFQGKDKNDNSLVFNISFMGKKFLLMGDASVETEKYMLANNIDLDCDILKVGHHGSKTSTCEEFLVAASPEEAIISAGAKNKYHHPDKEVIDRLEAHNIKIRRTSLEGSISYVQLAS